MLNAKQANIISIHTPTRGVTLPPRQIPGANIHFNPHSHKGSDDGFISHVHSYVISIHTPTRGVTRFYGLKVPFTEKISIHTPTRGVTEKSF